MDQPLLYKLKGVREALGTITVSAPQGVETVCLLR